ncbi:hypothetical protein Pan44_23150 [Caulifigura coniformis]|uniref:Uncharacterized protein n=1 Tax=Caulifigura coniformis TaxID=2527983 RepID=A0A517SDV4_9PLAN|nr:hypothetical protein [Caulifigura coniformis]QDT54287.1 hypothetical protein Pan44_23150 [Caulifigura coniformis]
MELAIHDVRFLGFNDPAPRRPRLKRRADVAQQSTPVTITLSPLAGVLLSQPQMVCFGVPSALDTFVAASQAERDADRLSGRKLYQAAVTEQIGYVHEIVGGWLKKQSNDAFNRHADELHSEGLTTLCIAVDKMGEKYQAAARKNPRGYIWTAVHNAILDYISANLHFGMSFSVWQYAMEKHAAIMAAHAADPTASNEEIENRAADAIVEAGRKESPGKHIPRPRWSDKEIDRSRMGIDGVANVEVDSKAAVRRSDRESARQHPYADYELRETIYAACLDGDDCYIVYAKLRGHEAEDTAVRLMIPVDEVVTRLAVLQTRWQDAEKKAEKQDS